MNVRIRFRTDNWHYAQLRMNGTAWAEYISIPREEYEALQPVQPGDIWRIHWGGPRDVEGNQPLAGYAIGCPKCREVHAWTTATNCEFQVVQHEYTSGSGVKRTYKVCGHSGKASCWAWAGSAEEGTLSASPSLLCHTCGYHGWLRNGELSDC